MSAGEDEPELWMPDVDGPYPGHGLVKAEAIRLGNGKWETRFTFQKQCPVLARKWDLIMWEINAEWAEVQTQRRLVKWKKESNEGQ